MRYAVFLSTLMCALVAQPAYADVIHVDVDANGAEDGRSWATAHTSLAEALARAREGDSIWIAEGVYRPDAVDPTRSFEVPPGVEVLGGFAGGERDRADADPSEHIVVLSGDMAGDDDTDADGVTRHAEDIVGTNSQHVVRVRPSSEAVSIDGVVITAGRAVHIDAFGIDGGGLHVEGAAVSFSRSTVIGNAAGFDGLGGGGGVHCEGDSETRLRIESVRFESNIASRRGGAISALTCALEVSDSAFVGNVAAETMPVAGCAGGHRGGGAVYAASGATRVELNFMDSRFEDNRAGCAGGAIAARAARIEVDRSLFRRNRALAPGVSGGVGQGGALHVFDSTGSFREVVVLANVAEQAGGAWYLERSGVSVINATAIGNQAVFGPFARVDGEGVSVFDVANSIVAQHGPDAVSIAERAGADLSARVHRSLIDTSFSVVDSDSCIVAAPTFRDPSTDAAEMEDMRLSPTSAGLGHADPDLVTSASDLLRQARSRGTEVDVGAIQTSVRCAPAGTARLYASERARGEATGTSWADAVSLADAIAFVDGCPDLRVGSIWIQGGIHHPDRGEFVDAGDVDASFVLPSYVVVRGSFAGDESTLGERDRAGRMTVLSGDLGEDDSLDPFGLVRTVAGANSRHVVYVQSTEGLLDRVAVTGGDAVGSRGGGVWIDGSDSEFQDVVVAGNFAEIGAGVAVQGALGPSFRRSMIVGNVARLHGGGVSIDTAPAAFDNVVLAGNVAPTGAGGWIARSEARFDFVDVTGNRALLRAGGLYLADGAQPRVTGSILFGNADGGRDLLAANLSMEGESAGMWLGTSIVQGSSGDWTGGMQDMGENWDVHPLFVEVLDPALAPSARGNFRLREGSPARDRGPRVTNIGMTDMSRAPRALDGDGDGFARPDIGAFEGSAVQPVPDVVADFSAVDVLLGPPATVTSTPTPTPNPVGMMDGGSCSVGVPGPGGSPMWLAALAVGLAFMRRRTR